MLKIKEAVIVEGKYDRQRLMGFIDAPIITTSGFRVFKDKEKQTLIRKLACERGLVIMTDSDSAGFVIRNFLRGIVQDADSIKHCYIPQIEGKEKRKDTPSKEGYLGVEGLCESQLREALAKSGVIVSDSQSAAPNDPVTKSDLYEMGLSGRENSAALRAKLLTSLGLPTYLSANALLSVINSLYSKQEVLDKLKNI